MPATGRRRATSRGSSTRQFEIVPIFRVEMNVPLLRAYRTRNPARFFGQDSTWGVIAPGAEADLVLLNANPLDDIANTRQIQAVMARGRLFDRSALDGFVALAERGLNGGSCRIP